MNPFRPGPIQYRYDGRAGDDDNDVLTSAVAAAQWVRYSSMAAIVLGVGSRLDVHLYMSVVVVVAAAAAAAAIAAVCMFVSIYTTRSLIRTMCGTHLADWFCVCEPVRSEPRLADYATHICVRRFRDANSCKPIHLSAFNHPSLITRCVCSGLTRQASLQAAARS